jgi:hypothetical protein
MAQAAPGPWSSAASGSRPLRRAIAASTGKRRVGHTPGVDTTERAERPDQLEHRDEARGRLALRRVRRLDLHAHARDAIPGVPPVVQRAGGNLDGALARTREAVLTVEPEADLALAHLEALDQVVVHVRARHGGAGPQPQVALDAPPGRRGRRSVESRELSGGGIVQPHDGAVLGSGYR